MTERLLNNIIIAGLLVFVFVSYSMESGIGKGVFVIGILGYMGLGWYVGGQVFVLVCTRKIDLSIKSIFLYLSFFILAALFYLSISAKFATSFGLAFIFIGFFTVAVVYFFSQTKMGNAISETERRLINLVVKKLKKV